MRRAAWRKLLCLLVAATCGSRVARAQYGPSDPLSSWGDDPSKQAIIEFVTQVTKQAGPRFVPVARQIAAFDNDGTLWSEQSIYFQFAFVLDWVKALAPKHPDWKEKQPFKAVLEGDMTPTSGRNRDG